MSRKDWLFFFLMMSQVSLFCSRLVTVLTNAPCSKYEPIISVMELSLGKSLLSSQGDVILYCWRALEKRGFFLPGSPSAHLQSSPECSLSQHSVPRALETVPHVAAVW